mgnify:CR=1 FL=1
MYKFRICDIVIVGVFRESNESYTVTRYGPRTSCQRVGVTRKTAARLFEFLILDNEKKKEEKKGTWPIN